MAKWKQLVLAKRERRGGGGGERGRGREIERGRGDGAGGRERVIPRRSCLCRHLISAFLFAENPKSAVTMATSRWRCLLFIFLFGHGFLVPPTG